MARQSMHKHVEAADGPQTTKNTNASVLKPGVKDLVKGGPKSQVKKGIKTATNSTKGN